MCAHDIENVQNCATPMGDTSLGDTSLRTTIILRNSDSGIELLKKMHSDEAMHAL